MGYDGAELGELDRKCVPVKCRPLLILIQSPVVVIHPDIGWDMYYPIVISSSCAVLHGGFQCRVDMFSSCLYFLI